MQKEECTSIAAADRAADELGYPVVVDGETFDKKADAMKAIRAKLKGEGDSVTISRPE